jgi:1-deoxy-D-xylulose-5-phosphate reductoisomerase
MRSLEFEPVDHARFPAINLAKRVIDAGGSSGAIFNAANEVAVEAFIAGSLHFGDIAAVVTDSLDRLPARAVHTLAEVLTADRDARECAHVCVAERAAHSAAATR